MCLFQRNSLCVLTAAALVGLLAGHASADELWTTNFEKARQTAVAEKKNMLVFFTGSDWCGPCNHLKTTIFDAPVFREKAPQDLVLVELDYPHEKKLPAEVEKQNQQLKTLYKITGYPTVLVMDEQGRPFASIGGTANDKPEEYLKILANLKKVREQRDKLLAEMEKAEGREKARLLDEILDLLERHAIDLKYNVAWGQEIQKIDADNQAGLNAKYQVKFRLGDVRKLIDAAKYDKALTAIESILKELKPADAALQETLITKGELQYQRQDYAEAKKTLMQAIAAAPRHWKVQTAELWIKLIEYRIKASEQK